MEILIFLIPLAVCIAFIGVIALFWAVGSGQYDDLDRAANSILFDNEKDNPKVNAPKKQSPQAPPNAHKKVP